MVISFLSVIFNIQVVFIFFIVLKYKKYKHFFSSINDYSIPFINFLKPL